MRSQPPRILPTLGLAVVWVALYLLWVAVRPAADPATATHTKGGSASSTTTTAPSPFRFKLKP